MSYTFEGIIPQELINAINKGKCILFVGSGLSSKVQRSNGKKLPNWNNFLKELLEWSINKNVTFWSDPSEISEMISKGNFLMAAQELQECVSINEFSDFLNQTFRDDNIIPTETHELINKINFRAILTSNYDSLIEGGYALVHSGKMPIKFTQEDLKTIHSPLRNNDFFVFKIHGDIDRPETIILGSRSYSNLMFRTPEYLNFLETLFTTHTVLFVGFGGSDPDLDYILDRLSTIFARTLDKHFILLPESKFNLTERRRLLLDRRLEVIEYKTDDNHSQVDKFLYSLSSFLEKKIDEQDVKELPKGVLIISSNKDRNIHKQIRNRVEENNHIYLGCLFSERFEESMINERYKFAQIVIVLFTENSVNSKQFEKELEYAILRESENQIKLYFIVVGDIDPPKIVMGKLYTRIKRLNESTIYVIDKILKNS